MRVTRQDLSIETISRAFRTAKLRRISSKLTKLFGMPVVLSGPQADRSVALTLYRSYKWDARRRFKLEGFKGRMSSRLD